VNYLPRLASNCGPLLLSTSQLARIIGVSHWHPVSIGFFFF
jgi:hypothetical protein